MAYFNISTELAKQENALKEPGTDKYSAEFLKTVALGEAIGLKVMRHCLGGEHDASAPHAAFATFPPGMVVPRHMHHCHRLEIIVAGSMVEAESGTNLTPGYVMASSPGVYYGPHIAGPDGVTTVEIFSTGPSGATPVLPEGGAFFEAFARDNKIDADAVFGKATIAPATA